MKKCSICGFEKEDFYIRKNGTLRSDCKDCFKKRIKENYIKKNKEIRASKKLYYQQNFDNINFKRLKIRNDKLEIINQFKKDACCDCGKIFPNCVMDFDHREPQNKKAGISKILNSRYSVTVLLAELQKCDLVCACCHRNRTYKIWQESKRNRKRDYPIHELKQEFIDSQKVNKPCADCQGLFNAWQMDFDHLANKKFSLGKVKRVSCSIETIYQEMQKCELVCANCHRVRTQIKLGKPVG